MDCGFLDMRAERQTDKQAHIQTCSVIISYPLPGAK